MQFESNVEIEFAEYPGLRVTYEAGKATIGADSVFGMNMLMLYTEDMFPLENYPFFGYKRGRYSLDELRELDAYAWELGIEMIPCVQTLGHLERYLSWPEAAPLRDTSFNLMPGTKESMDLIEEILKTMKSALRSRHIHVGMDEVVDLGTGAYFRKHKGEVIDQQALLFDHLKKVCSLCEKYDYEPIIWSDLFFPNPKGGQIFTYDSYFPKSYRELYAILGSIRRKEMKAFGWEQHSREYGFQLARLDYAMETLSAYLSGEITGIEELEAAPLHCGVREWDTTRDD